MKNAILYLIFIYLSAPNAFCTKISAQSIPADEESQQPAGDSVDTETAGGDASAGEGETGQQPADMSADVQATSEETPEGEPSEEPKAAAAETKETVTEIAVPEPSPSPSQPAVAQSTSIRTAPLVSSPTSPRPSSGTGFIITGSIVLGMGGLFLLATPSCYVVFDDSSYDEAVDYVNSQYEGDYVIRETAIDDNKETARDFCLVFFLGLGGVHVAIGLPLLIVGLDERSDYNDWRKKNPELAGFDFRINKHQVVASWKMAF